MVENIDINGVVGKLSEEFDALIDEREEVRAKSATLKARADEIDRKIAGIQKTLQGLTLYTTAQETPTELTKKTTQSLAEVMGKMQSFDHLLMAGPDVRKTLSECCRDILRAKRDWMSPIEVREALYAAGFDFSGYTSNPLSSIHTALKRMAPEELVTETRGEGQVYRWAVNTQKAPENLIPPNTPAASLPHRESWRSKPDPDPVRKLGEGARFPKRGVDTKPNAAFESGMRGNEKPKK
jgi:hypothetical protein